MFAFGWLLWGIIAWWLARTVARTHGATFKQSLKVAFTRNPRKVLENIE